MIMKFFSAVIIVFSSFALYAQDEGTVPMTQNTDIAGCNRIPLKINVGTFDSTFIFSTDTLTLPIFDDFTINIYHICFEYPTNFNDRPRACLPINYDCLSFPFHLKCFFSIRLSSSILNSLPIIIPVLSIKKLSGIPFMP